MDSINRAVIAWHIWRTPAVILRALRDDGSAELETAWQELPDEERNRLQAFADQLSDAGVEAWLFGDADYPAALADLKSPPPVVFSAGNKGLMERRAIGVCGSRAASSEGLEAARVLARAVALKGQVTVAGNAAGIDAEAQGSALAAGGSVITVLPEGISHFRLRTGANDADYSEDQLLVISQFPPGQPWSVGGAMTRNMLIATLVGALVVIEAGDRGGTLAAGEAGLRLGRPVIALEFGAGTPPGNARLIQKGAKPARTPRELNARLEEAASPLARGAQKSSEQLPLTI